MIAGTDTCYLRLKGVAGRNAGTPQSTIVDTIISRHNNLADSHRQELVNNIDVANAQTSTPWLGLTKLDRHLHDVAIPGLTRLTYLPNFRYGQHAAYLRHLNEAVTVIFEDTYTYLPTVSRNLREWAASPTKTEPARLPLRQFQSSATWNVYVNVWRRILLYMARVAMQDPDEDMATMSRCVELMDACTGSSSNQELQDALGCWIALLQNIGRDEFGQKIAPALTIPLKPASIALILAMITQVYDSKF